jgi:PTH1 family peptidyl-tRNA hydrolase
MISLVAFLGNYGAEYEDTRHNIAWLFEAALPFSRDLNWQHKFKGQYVAVGGGTFAHWMQQFFMTEATELVTQNSPADMPKRLFFLKPETYMNLSGNSIGEIVHFFKIRPDEVLVVHDELELPLGTVSLKWSGGLGGHNGLRSTKAVLGTPDFWRLRFGIGRPERDNVADYVLAHFAPEELSVLAQVFPRMVQFFLSLLLSSDPSALLPAWGKKKIVSL